MSASHQAALLVPPAAGLGFQLLQTWRNWGRSGPSAPGTELVSLLGDPQNQSRQGLQPRCLLFFSPLWGLTQGLQLKLVFVCCSLSRAQQCSLQWLAAALFPAPQGSDIYCFTKSF